ncbi:MarR family winged helix-turn-helix transcriptional regulator [Chloroflexota bacterium]
MPVKFTFNEPRLMAWLLCHQCYNLVSRCEEVTFANTQITPEQHAVLLAIKNNNGPVGPTSIAKWLDRSPNSISLMIQRMEKRGLVNQARDLPDLRSVRLVITKKGDKILEQATSRRWNLIQEILSDVSQDDLQTLIRLMELIRGKAFHYLKPKGVMENVG